MFLSKEQSRADTDFQTNGFPRRSSRSGSTAISVKKRNFNPRMFPRFHIVCEKLLLPEKYCSIAHHGVCEIVKRHIIILSTTTFD